ncbi:HD family phosphohydrolase [Caldanaerobius polysaccharolyticus]|uniref:HD family phosphohydrolase n=1 Tax=Caldanaerobius polysaccharolyticus TaxID=44256 RepID=UPI00068F9C28|nr:HDIG domain-containing metalloprotein [Caldanaerobius polysaccharolyticus]
MLSVQRRFNSLRGVYGRTISPKGIEKLILLAAVYIIVFLVLLNGVSPKKYELKVGDISYTDIKAPRDFIDEYATKRKVDAAVNAVKPKYDLDDSVLQQSQSKVEGFFNEFISRGSDKLNISAVKSYIDMDDKLIEYLQSLKVDQLTQLKTIAIKTVDDVLSKPVPIDSIDSARLTAKNQILTLDIPDKSRSVLMQIIDAVIKPNMIYNEEETRMAKMQAAQSVEKVMYKKGQSIIKSGDIVTPDQYRILKAMGLLKDQSHTDLWLYAGVASFSSLLIGILTAYIVLFKKDLKEDISKLLLLSILFILPLLFLLAFKDVSVYYIPISSFAMLSTVIFDFITALIGVLALLIIGSSIIGFTPALISIGFVGPIVAIMMLHRANHRNALMWTGLAVSAANSIGVISLGLINSSDIMMVFKESPWGILNGLVSTVFAIGTLPFWEAAFCVVTPMRLIELSNPDQPLLKKLLLDAPGTYHHSVIVANLAEAAASEIGADRLLARVGAYYHDIGKTTRPYFFKENQLTMDNPHDRISPDLSYLVIVSHVKDGSNMAKKYRLPGMIRDIIEQHHGTTLVSYFYNKALNTGSECEEKDYKYPGPKPTSKEAALVMLADSVEAAVRSMSDPTEEGIDKMIKKIIRMRMEDGQFDSCDLTFKDLGDIATAFKKVLMGIFHDRIEYPEVQS